MLHRISRNADKERQESIPQFKAKAKTGLGTDLEISDYSTPVRPSLLVLVFVIIFLFLIL